MYVESEAGEEETKAFHESFYVRLEEKFSV